MRTVKTTVGIAVLALGIAGCAQPPHEHAHENTVTVVASTDVWGSVAGAVVGDHATVKSILSGPAADPHSFEASPADAAAITDASLVVYNGGGYDHWVEDVLANHPDIASVDAYALVNAGDPANEHVFYDPAAAKAVATRIADQLAGVDEAHADDYRANAAAFGRQADALLESERSIAKQRPGAAVVATEPVAFYLVRNAGLTDRTPPGFASAVEEGDDPSPADVAAMLDLINSRQVAALLFNPQTETPATKQISDAARRASVPVVVVSETLPEGTDYLGWQRQTVEQLAGALQTAR
ncbi:metal ABC transporter solute-binding protein, Zn/Mn family [Mycobacterium hubeiense]|uniref:metal ABC transporter solute-binding protein, Zn/Mn family n=1 Tax=Mycobacterium hubeiense TaxID=1867256 RepID=UPI000C7ED43D|nr:zinc ABC transporter substrate-binding protein [Mycobacterium sp. QGD 101]